MRNIVMKYLAALLVVWYSLSIIGFDVHSCTKTGETFVASIAAGVSCEDMAAAAVMTMTRTAADMIIETRLLPATAVRTISMSLHSPEQFLLMTIVTMTALQILLPMQLNTLRRFLSRLIQTKIS